MIRRLFALFFVVLFFAIAGVVAMYVYLSQPVSTSNIETRFVIAKGSGVQAIATQLEQKKLIRSRYVFRYEVMVNTLEKKLQAGSYTLSPSQTPREIAYALTQGSDDIWITFLEGWRVEEIGEEAERVLGNEFFSLSDFLSIVASDEGFLYPDSYLVPREISAEGLAKLLKKTFSQKTASVLEDGAKKLEKTPFEVVTMASLLEREARGTKDMQIVAGILWKRLDADWPLQLDATLQYARGKTAGGWWEPPFAKDKEITSPYNTYLYAGMPEGPICNPSLEAIQAALTPKESEYWYYLTDNDGVMRYAVTLAEHQKNVETYLR
ncbi:MAG: Aminodeoxychorismate lyase [Microgenomates group bacterium GW2011_GWF2_45_18]|nr:MAG: Aminodeoxychorismate lyase [Microgenomates group bacterium GW2011_GWF1_44_10]KKU01956.1 MAG: Aminodeoxychorismate lyase [Microgenomates group bacterium GW2011_GWF2_45_18]OGJ41030.1 MAG: hypothetical protein A2378_03955 [Candidatus Pacebacteria bacterium RIFOXYB1_FULL_44_10]HAU99059.1 endolytic transglycosylase MltG [Candidatus Paceibacterota bacterium]